MQEEAKASKVLRYPGLVFLATVGMLMANAIPGAMGFRGETVGSISDKIPSLMTPAGYAFSIWSLIYASLLGFAFYQLSPSRREDREIAQMELWYIASCLLNSAWIFIWLSKLFFFSLFVIVLLLICLVRIYVSFDGVRATREGASAWWLIWPFSIYTAWVTVATVINAVIALKAIGWEGGGISPVVWSLILIVVACLIVGWIALPRRDATYIGVLIWALVAIGVANQERAPAVMWIAWIAAALMSLLYFSLWALHFSERAR
jgi:hypothetical protein